MCVILCIRDGTYSLKSIPNDRFSWQFHLLSEFYMTLLYIETLDTIVHPTTHLWAISVDFKGPIGKLRLFSPEAPEVSILKRNSLFSKLYEIIQSNLMCLHLPRKAACPALQSRLDHDLTTLCLNATNLDLYLNSWTEGKPTEYTLFNFKAFYPIRIRNEEKHKQRAKK